MNIKTVITTGVIGVATFAPFAVDNNNNITISQKNVLNEIKTKIPAQKNSNLFVISHSKLLELMDKNFFSKESVKKINKFLFDISVQMTNKGYIRKAQF